MAHPRKYLWGGCLIALLTLGSLPANSLGQDASRVWEELSKETNASVLLGSQRPKIDPNTDVLVVGGNLEIAGNESWSASDLPTPGVPIRNSAPTAVIVIGKLHIIGVVQIHLPATRVMLWADEILLESGAKLIFTQPSVKLQYSTSGRMIGAPPMSEDSSVAMLASRVIASGMDVPSLPTTGGDRAFSLSNVLQLPSGSSEVKFDDSMHPYLFGILEAGKLKMYEAVNDGLRLAALHDRRAEGLAWVKTARSLPDPDAASPYKDRFGQLSAEILSERKQFDKSLLIRTFYIDQPGSGVQRPLTAYAVGDSLDNTVEPDIATVQATNDGPHSLAILTKDPISTEQLRLYMSAKLSADPWMVEMLRKNLRAMGENVAGIFTRRSSLKAVGLPAGVIRSEATLDGDLIDLDLTLDRSMAGIILTRLCSPLGLAIQFSWTSTDDPQVVGQMTIRVTLQRNSDITYDVSGLKVTNTSTRSIAVGYVGNDIGDYWAVNKEVPAGSALSVADSFGKGSRLVVPREAVTWPLIDPNDAALMFQIPDANELLQSISISNRLSAYDNANQRHLQKALLRLRYEVRGTGSAVTIEGGTVVLAPAGTEGFRAERRFVKPLTGAVSVAVSGTAVYDTGPVNLKEKRFDTTDVNVADDMLP
jgi:hypothetical protein